MWSGLTNLTQSIKDRAENVAREVGLEEHLAQARSQVSNLSNLTTLADSLLTVDKQQSGSFASRTSAAGAKALQETHDAGVSMDPDHLTLHHERMSNRSSPAKVVAGDGWGEPSSGFDDIPLTTTLPRPAILEAADSPTKHIPAKRSPADGMSTDIISKGVPSAHSDSLAQHAAALEAENSRLKERLQAVEAEAVDVLGELADAREALHDAERCAARAAEDAADARRRREEASELECANTALAQRVAALEAQLQEQSAANGETLPGTPASCPLGQTQASPVSSKAAPGGGDEVVELKARLTKAKRQALAFKNKAAEAASARDAALAEVAEFRRVQVAQVAAMDDMQRSVAALQAEAAEAAASHRRQAAEIDQAAVVNGVEQELTRAQCLAPDMDAQPEDARNQQAGLTSLALEAPGGNGQQGEERVGAADRQTALQEGGKPANDGIAAEGHTAEGQSDMGRSIRALESASPRFELAATSSSAADGPERPETPMRATAPHNAAAALRAALDERDAQVEELMQRLEGAEEGMATLRAALVAQEQAAATELARHCDEAAAQLAARQQDLASLQAAADMAAAAAKERLVAQQAAASEDLAQRERELGAALEAECTAAKRDGARWRAKMDELQEDVDEARAQEQRLTTALEATCIQAEAHTSGPEKQPLLAQLQMRVAELEAQLVQPAPKLPDAAESASNPHSGPGSLDQCPEGSGQRLEASQPDADSAAAAAASLAEEAKSVREALAQAQAEMAASHKTAAALALQLADMRAEAQDAQGAAAAAHESLAAARAEARDAQAGTAAAEARAQRVAEEAAGAREGLQAALAAALDELQHAKAEEQAHSAELAAVRGGATAEAGRAAAGVAEAQARAAAAQAREAELRSAAIDIAAELDAAQEAAQEAASAAAQRQAFWPPAMLKSVEARLAEAEQRADVAEAQLAAAQADAQRHTAAAAEAREEVDAARRKAEGQAEAHVAAMEEVAAARAALEQRLQELEAALQGQATERDDLAAELAAAIAKVEQLQTELAGKQELQRQLTAAQAGKQATADEAAQAIAQARAAEAAATERHRKFVMLNAGYRKNEVELRAALEAAQGAAATSAAAAANAQQQAVAAQKEVEALRGALVTAEGWLQEETAARELAEAARTTAKAGAAAAAESAAAAEAALATERNAVAAALRRAEEADSRTAAALAEQEAAAVQRLASAEVAAAAARSEAEAARARATTAEEAKIQLSLKLAQLASQKPADVSGVPAPREDEKTWAARLEEAELAAAVGARRAATAEAELEELKKQLDAAQKRANELAWQIKMVADPQQFSGRAAAGSSKGGAASMFDMFGCGANFRR